MIPRRFSAHGRRWGVLLMPAHEFGHDYISKWVIPWDEHFDPFVPRPVAPPADSGVVRGAEKGYDIELFKGENRIDPLNSIPSEDTPN